jgi:FAD-dependent urate hydroxylase
VADAETVILGAGPYGLSIAAHMKARKLPFEILGTPLETWRAYMPDNMVLRSEPFASNLWDPRRKYTLKQFSAEKKTHYQPICNPIPIREFLDYTEWFRQGAVGEVRDAKVQRLRRNSHNFILDLTDGSTVKARRVVVATGLMPFRHVPPEYSHLAAPLCMHSSMLGDLKRYSGRDCTIIGAGQSALETAALLSEAGARVRIIARKDQLSWNTKPSAHRTLIDWICRPEAGICAGWSCWAVSELPRVFRWLFPAEKRHRFVASRYGPAGAWWLRERVEGKIELLLGHKIRQAEDAAGRVRLVVEGPDGPAEILTDHLIAATGFKTDLDRLEYLDPELKKNIKRESYAPLLDASFETSVPNLFFVGILSAPTFGPVMRFMFGAKHTAPILASRLTSR